MNESPAERQQIVDGPRHGRTSRVLSILFFLFYSLSLLALSPGSHIKPFEYYFFVSLCGGLIAIDIILVGNRVTLALNLTKSYLLALNIFLSSQLIFPYGIGGADSATHLQALVYQIVGTGHVPPTGFAYSSFPFHHIFVAMNSLVLGADPSIGYYSLGPFVLSSGVFFAFLLGRCLLSEKAGLLAALMFPASAYIIYWASHPAQLTYVLPFIGILILVIQYLYKRRSLGFKVITPILILAVVFSHPYSTIILLVILLSIVVVERIFIRRRRTLTWGVSYVFLIFLGMQLLHWIYYSNMFVSAVDYGKRYYEAIIGEPLAAFPTVYDYYPLSEIFLNTLGVSLVVMLSICGFFFFLGKSSLRKKVVVGYTIALVGLALVGLFLKLVYILPNRIFLYLEALALIFLFAGGIRYFGLDQLKRGHFSPRHLSLVAIVILVFFFSTSSTIAGQETSLFAKDQPHVKLYETVSERQSVNWMNEYFPEQSLHSIYTGRSFSRSSQHLISKEIVSDDENISRIPLTITHDVDVQSIENRSAILFSRFDIEIGFSTGQKVGGRYGQGILMRFEEDVLHDFSVFQRCYDNGKIILFMAT